ncbi:hypothetical protein RIF29_24705 [Crotalaria pallida]|uniref:Uncharacterized protein n=1 Tax=Crotalaria pallida TaxID=3830 RepID=A0AAN9EKU7_CROPI
MVAWQDPKSLQSLEAVGVADRPHHQTSEGLILFLSVIVLYFRWVLNGCSCGGVIVRGEVVGKWYGDGETVGDCAGAEKVEMRGDGATGFERFQNQNVQDREREKGN